MTRSTTTRRLALGAGTAVLSMLALAGPADAQLDPDPRGCAATDTCGIATFQDQGTKPSVVADDSNTTLSLALGAVGGIAIAGVGIVAASSLQRRRETAVSRAR